MTEKMPPKSGRQRFFTVTIIQIGDELGFRLPQRIVREFGLKDGDRVTLTIKLRKTSGFGTCRGAGRFVGERDGHRDIGPG
jgi:hypothetical protein